MCYLLNHIASSALDGKILLLALTGISPDISIILLFTFYQPVFYHDTQKIIYRSAVRPKKSSTCNHRLAPHGGDISASCDPSEDKISSGSPLGYPEGSSPEQKAPTVFIRSRDEENPSGSKSMPTFDPSDLICRTLTLS